MSRTGLEGRHALVTGGGRGIGRAIAAQLVESRRHASLSSGEIKPCSSRPSHEGDAHGWAIADVSDLAAVQTAVQKAITLNGPVDLMVANAGAAVSAPFMKTSPDIFRQMLDVNLLGVTNMAQAVLELHDRARLWAHRRRGLDRRP